MFWGLIVKPNKKYSKTVSTPFHVSQAVVDVNASPGDGDIQLYLRSDNVEFILCSLNKTDRIQIPLNLIFSQGDEISFRSVGGTVHLTGYLVDEQNFPEYEEGESSDDEVPELVDTSQQSSRRQQNGDSSGSDDLSVDDDEEGSDEEGDDDDDDDDSANDANEGSDDDDDSDDDQGPPPKISKSDDKEKKPVVTNGVSKKGDKAKDGKQQQKKQQPPTGGAEVKSESKPTVTSNGLIIQDIRDGKGAEVKAGRKVQVYYEGRFKSNNKVFDKSNSGKGFEFVVGRGYVIKGWDVGVLGMKVGGKRRITCPPHMAYGKKGSPPAIPANSTLVFDIELRNLV